METIEPELIEPDEDLSVTLAASGGTDERLALIRAHGRVALAKTVMGGLAIVSFFGFMSTCVYVTCG